MRVVGAPLGTVYCIGDASTVRSFTTLLRLLLILRSSLDRDFIDALSP